MAANTRRRLVRALQALTLPPVNEGSIKIATFPFLVRVVSRISLFSDFFFGKSVVFNRIEVSFSGSGILLPNWAMDDLDLDFPNPEVFPGPDVGDQMPGNCWIDGFFDESVKDMPRHSCTHTHTCNPPGGDLSHTHTCFHAHTRILSAPSNETSSESAEKSSSKKRPIGNREAVRKYREKKKAHTASLEDEIVQLRALNQQLMKRLQGQVALEAEVARLRCLLVDIRGRIEGEIGAFPYNRAERMGGDLVSNATQGNLFGAHIINSCNVRCDDQINCMQSVMQGEDGDEDGALDGENFDACEIGNIRCMGSSSTGSKVILTCGHGNANGNAMAAGCSSKAKKTKGSCAAATTDG